ncbi:SIS domain-containing protein [Ruminococcaceae bacterium OttesenSCG-928-D13]|nr:SIS domain-containing protein [Ruminococcaceae bacterium OttesenSCG-928-D13]
MKGALAAYFDAVTGILEEVRNTQADGLEQLAQLLARAITDKGAIFTFGCNHAGLLAQELFYRSGGLVTVNCIRAPGLCLDVDPPTLTSAMERLPDYGRDIVAGYPIKTGDVVIIHSVSGRNTVTVDVALAAREAGATVVALTNLRTAGAVPSRHPGGKNLHQVSQLVLDNCGHYGDAALQLEGLPQPVAPTSTAVGAVMLNAAVARCVELLLEQGVTPPVFLSANVPQGDAHNEDVMGRYQDQIFYNMRRD